MVIDVSSVSLENVGRWREDGQVSSVDFTPIEIVFVESCSQLMLSLLCF